MNLDIVAFRSSICRAASHLTASTHRKIVHGDASERSFFHDLHPLWGGVRPVPFSPPLPINFPSHPRAVVQHPSEFSHSTSLYYLYLSQRNANCTVQLGLANQSRGFGCQGASAILKLHYCSSSSLPSRCFLQIKLRGAILDLSRSISAGSPL